MNLAGETVSKRERNPRKNPSHSFFAKFANRTSRAAGHPAAFCVAVLVILGWAVCGPIFGYSDTWQLIINTGTTIITFLMVFLIQNTQNRDSTAMHLKLDELIRALDSAQNTVMNLEELGDKDLQVIRKRYQALADKAHDENLEAGAEDVEKSAAAPKNGGSARGKRAEHNRKRG